MLLRTIRALFFYSIFLTIFACASTPVHQLKNIPDIREVNLKALDNEIEQGNPLAAWETNDNLFYRKLISQDEQASNRIRITTLLTEKFSQACEEGDTQRCLVLKNAAIRLGIDLQADSGAGLEHDLLQKLIDNGNRIAAYATAAELLRQKKVTSEEISPVLKDAEESGYNSWAMALTEPLATFSEASSIREDLPGIVNSTVTIWVNRGIRIQGGMGYPDRVIGSGFFIDKKGYLLTNYHVIESEVNPEYEGFSRLYIRPSGTSGTKIPAKVIGWDSILDLALLKTEVEPEYTFTPGFQDLKLGEPIYAIGSPGGLEKTITSGIVSAVDRRLLQIGDAMQIDVPINQGNSGGPLLNERGELVGIVFAGIETFEGINFAIPSFWMLKILPRLYAGGEVIHSWIGASMHEGEEGLTCLYAFPGYPAQRSGIKTGDRLVKINDKPVNTLRQVHEILVGLKPGELVTAVWMLPGEAEAHRTFVLDKRPVSPIGELYNRGAEEDLILPLFGMEVESTGSTLWEKSYVIRKVYSGSVADETGLSVNDPFYWRGLKVDSDAGVAILQMIIKKRKAGFLESSMQIGAYIKTDDII